MHLQRVSTLDQADLSDAWQLLSGTQEGESVSGMQGHRGCERKTNVDQTRRTSSVFEGNLVTHGDLTSKQLVCEEEKVCKREQTQVVGIPNTC